MAETVQEKHGCVSLRAHIQHADNQLVIFVNGVKAYDKRTEYDPPLNDQVDLTTFLMPGRNVVTVVGVDWGKRSHYVGTIVADGQNFPFNFLLEDQPVSAGLNFCQSLYVYR